ncbi:hypothetical protein SK128_022600, partial [Halocaridina rubra]
MDSRKLKESNLEHFNEIAISLKKVGTTTMKYVSISPSPACMRELILVAQSHPWIETCRAAWRLAKIHNPSFKYPLPVLQSTTCNLHSNCYSLENASFIVLKILKLDRTPLILDLSEFPFPHFLK